MRPIKAMLVGASAPAVTFDLFDTDTIASYTTSASGWSVTGGQMVSTNHLNSICTRNGVAMSNGAIECDISQAQDAGLIMRVQDVGNYYLASISDASGTTPNTVKLWKRVSGTFTQLGSTGTIAFTRGTVHTLKLECIGTALKIYFDGVEKVSATDSVYSTGLVGMRSNVTAVQTDKFDAFRWNL